MLEDTRLKIFMAVADEGSFTRAAYLLGITQPAVSQNIAELERETGRVLFVRGRGAVTLTPDGERFRIHVSRILQEHAALDTVFSTANLQVVSIAATPYLLHSFVPSLLMRLSARFPARFSVCTLPEGDSPGEADISFYTVPCSDALDFGSFPMGTVSPVCLSASPGVSPVSAPILLWTPYRKSCDASVLGRVVMDADDPALLIARLKETPGAVAFLPSVPETADFQFYPATSFLPVLDIRCRMKDEFARTAPGEFIKDSLE